MSNRSNENNSRGIINKQKSDFFIDALHIFVLCNFAVAQPLFDLLSRNAEFFVARHSEPVDVILLIIILCVLLPVLLILIEVPAGLFGRRARKVVHVFVVACLVAIIVLPALSKIFKLSGSVLVVGAALLGVLTYIAYIRFNPVRIFFTVLSPVLLIFPGLFLFNSPVFKVVFPKKTPSSVTIKVGNPVPIIMLIFDEFPVSSLMDEHHQIDPIRYPNFAALARDSYWFRNATTVSNGTHQAIPAILTGSNPDIERLATAADYPNNLFTLLEGSYRMKVFESTTTIFRKKHRRDEKRLAQRMNRMLLDLSAVYLNILLPSDLSGGLPIVTQTWKNFGIEANGDKAHGLRMILDKKMAFYEDRARLFSEFVESINVSDKPTLYFSHLVLPHVPWGYLPSGRVYTETRTPGFEPKYGPWGSDEWLVIQGHQRHLLQVGFVDKLIGDLIAKLKNLDIYDKSLIVITADHGANFRPNRPRRSVLKEDPMGVLGVPLFIKAPNQHEGIISDRNVKTIDILPTIADLLDINLPWPTDGRSAIHSSIHESTLDVSHDSLKRKLNLFGSGTKHGGLFKIGPHNDLIGRSISAIDMMWGNAMVELNQAPNYADVDPNASYTNSHITGRVFLNGSTGTKLNLAIGINGTIRAVTRTLPFEGGIAEWFAMVPEKVFRKGKNEVEVFVVSIVEGQLRLDRARSQLIGSYSLSLINGQNGEIITSPDGKSIPVIANALRGYWTIARVGSDHVVFVGWAADVKNSQLPEAVVMFANGKYLHSGSCNVDRKDVAIAFKNDELNNSGFRYLIPLALFKDIAYSEVRIFAVSKNGVAAELRSPVYAGVGVEGFVTRFYQKCLDRVPDVQELEGWLNALENGSLAGADVANSFIFSEEFINRNTSNEEFVIILYRAFFDREPDTGGYNSLVNYLYRGASRKAILNGFINSQEFENLCESYGINPYRGATTEGGSVQDFVTRFYQQCLRREPEQEGLNGWVAALQNGSQFGADFAKGIIFSPEFINRNTSNEEFVTILYRALLDREPDTGGYNGWLNQLSSGISRQDVLNGFIYSKEFENLCNSYGIAPYSS